MLQIAPPYLSKNAAVGQRVSSDFIDSIFNAIEELLTKTFPRALVVFGGRSYVRLSLASDDDLQFGFGV